MFGQNRHRKTYPPPKTQEEAERRLWIVCMKMQGVPHKEIRSDLMSVFQLTEKRAEEEIQWCYLEMKENTERSLDNVTTLHIERYEKLFRIFSSLQIDSLSLKCMKQKEDLLDLNLDENKVLDIENIFASGGGQSPFNLTLLSKEEKNELFELLKLATR